MNNGKAIVEKTINGLTLIIPSKKNWFVLVFSTFWMGGWFFGFITVLNSLISETTNNIGVDGFLIFWLLGWTAGGITIIVISLWGYFGKEYFVIDRNQVLFEKTVFGIGKKNKFEKSELKNFRVEYVNESMFQRNNWSAFGFGSGKIKFDYGLKTFSFGLGVNDAEANYIVEILNKEFQI